MLSHAKDLSGLNDPGHAPAVSPGISSQPTLLLSRKGPPDHGGGVLSCRDEDWERLKARASHAGSTSVSAFIVEAALAVDPTRPRMDAALAMEQQETITQAARRLIAHLPAVPPEKATPLWATLHGRISFLVRTAIDDMLDQGRRCDLEHHLDRQFGAGSGERMVAAYLERTGRDDIPE